jgi:hypothetical protein
MACAHGVTVDQFCAMDKNYTPGCKVTEQETEANRGCAQLKRGECALSDACAWNRKTKCTDKPAPPVCGQLSNLKCRSSKRCKMQKTVTKSDKQSCQAKGKSLNDTGCSRITRGKLCRKSELGCKWKIQKTETQSCVEK